MKRLVIFDLDGTLLDTLGDLKNAVNHAMRSVGHEERTADEVRSFIGNGTKKLLERALGNSNDEALLSRCLEIYTGFYTKNYAVETKPYEGISWCVDKLLDNGVICAVVTNKLHDISVDLCAKYFPDRFSLVVGDKTGIKRKPDPSAVLDVMRTLDCDRVAYVGDSCVDVLTAKNASIPCVAMTWGYNSKEQLEDAGAEIYADNASELFEYLKTILFNDEKR